MLLELMGDHPQVKQGVVILLTVLTALIDREDSEVLEGQENWMRRNRVFAGSRQQKR